MATWENKKVVKKLLKRPLPPDYTVRPICSTVVKSKPHLNFSEKEDKFQSEVSLKATIGGHRCLGILGCGIEANQAFILQEYGGNLSLRYYFLRSLFEVLGGDYNHHGLYFSVATCLVGRKLQWKKNSICYLRFTMLCYFCMQ